MKLFLRCTGEQGLLNLSLFTGTAHQQVLSVLRNQLFGYVQGIPLAARQQVIQGFNAFAVFAQ